MGYTLELRYIAENPCNKVFSFNYDFYDEEHKAEFERKFIQHYYFDEIGFETIDKFKQRLKSKLDLIAPYYNQLYITELESKKCNFMLNKDLRETFIREIENNTLVNSNMENTSNAAVQSDGLSIMSDTPQGSINDIDRYMNQASKDNGNSVSNSSDVNTANSDTKNSGTEKTELISQGNIGVTSSGSLLEDWRKILINIDEMIINECKELFLMVY